MPRYKLTIEYDGSPYSGWQLQDNQPTVQGALEKAIEQLCEKLCRLHVAGRTDAGVHAWGQVAHFDSPREYNAERVKGALNFYLHNKPPILRGGREGCISILHAEQVADDFHARFSATGRRYLYRILNRSVPPTIDKGRVWHVPEKLDIALMQAGAAHLLGTHDFTSFRASECQSKSPIKTLTDITITKAEQEIHLRFAAPSFLHHMVRNMTGSLKKVGQGRWAPEKIQTVLETKDRAAAAETAPACGLYLTEVVY
jgi:tRNA pseudouridine38-40 synthase